MLRSAIMAGLGNRISPVHAQILVAGLASASTLGLWFVVPNAAAPLILPAIGFAVLAVFGRPDLIAIGAVFLLNFKIHEISPALAPAAVLSTAFAALALLALIFRLLLAPPRRMQWHAAPVLLLALWALLTMGVALAQDRSLAFDTWTEYSKVLLLTSAIITMIRTERQIALFAGMCVIAGVILSFSTIVIYRLGIDLVEGTRAYAGVGTLSNPNDAALILLLPLSLAITAALSPLPTIPRFLSGFAAVVISYAILLCQSRGAILGIGALLAATLYRRVKSKLLFVALAALVLTAVPPILQAFERDVEGIQSFEDQSAQDRIHAWYAGVAMAKKFPLHGVGVGNFTSQYPDYTAAEPGGPTLTAHSIWFLVLGEAGWPGLAIFVSFALVSLRDSLRSIKIFETRSSIVGRYLATAIFGGFVSFFVSGSFVSYAYQWPLYVLFILNFTLLRLAMSDSAAEATPDSRATSDTRAAGS